MNLLSVNLMKKKITIKMKNAEIFTLSVISLASKEINIFSLSLKVVH